MKTWVRKTLSVGVLAAGALLLAPGAAHAGVSQDSSDNNGILNGTQIAVPVAVPLNIVGNAIGVAGEANAAGAGYNWLEGGHKAKQNSSDNNGIANGLQAYAPIDIPINACGNALGILGEANAAAQCSNGDKGGNGGHGHGHGGNGGNNGDHDYDDNDGNGGNNGGNNGGYDGHGDDDDVDGNGGANNAGYEDHQGRKGAQVHGKSATEASPVAGLTDGLTKNGNVPSVAGLDLLKTLG
jgi:hypothetical protein